MLAPDGTLIADLAGQRWNAFVGSGFVVMFIHEMTFKECLTALENASVGRLACEHDGQPYAVPINFAFDGTYLYGFTTLGQKVEWMRANPLVCLEVDEVVCESQWMSLVVFARYEELPDAPDYEQARTRAQALLQKRAIWWEPAALSQEHRDQPHSSTPIVYRLHVQKITGHRASPDEPSPRPDGESLISACEKSHRTRT